MSQAIVDLNADTFKKGDVLTRSGKTATVVAPAIHRTSRKFIGYDVDLLTDGSGFVPQRVTLFTADIRNNWTFKPAAEPATASFPIGVSFEINDEGDAVPESEAAPVATDSDANWTDDDGSDDDLIQALQAELADAQRTITRLEKENEFFDARCEDLIESRDSAIHHAEAVENRFTELTEQLAEARAELASFKSPSMRSGEGLGVGMTSAPVREFKIMRDITEADLCKMEKDEWQIQHMQFENGLNVVYFRYCQPAPVAPEPRKTVQPVGPHLVTIIPDTSAKPPRFDAETYLADMLMDCQNAAQEATADMPPAYQQLMNPRPLILSANPVKPEVR